MLDASGNFSKVLLTVTPLGPRSDILEKAAAQAGKLIPNVFSLGDDMPGHIYAGATLSFAVQIPVLRIRTYYKATGTGESLCMTPWFSSEDAIEFQCDWQPPADCKLYFLTNELTCYLLAVHTDPATGAKTVRRLPMPNLHTDAHICMGNFYDSIGSAKQVEWKNTIRFIKEGLTHFSTSMWNMDLGGEGHRTIVANFMRFGMQGKNLPALQAWHQYAPIVSAQVFNWLVQLP
jgi:hypothetical protein